MSNDCRSLDRNFCAPNGKKVALFVDIDDTIMVNAPYFQEARESFMYFMHMRGFDKDEALARLKKVNIELAESEGFERSVFTRTVIEAYRQLVAEKRRRFTAAQRLADERMLFAIASLPFFRDPELFPHAAGVLSRAHHNFLIFAVSIGSRDVQKYKISAGGLSTIFDDLIITDRDDKAELVAKCIADNDIDPTLSAFIGNSVRSDGACLAVTNFIYLPLGEGWDFDKTRALPANTGFQVFEASNWRQAEESGIKRLLRRRRNTPQTLPTAHGCKCQQSGQ